eukprot:3910899-Rhodomonas_salina.1
MADALATAHTEKRQVVALTRDRESALRDHQIVRAPVSEPSTLLLGAEPAASASHPPRPPPCSLLLLRRVLPPLPHHILFISRVRFALTGVCVCLCVCLCVCVCVCVCACVRAADGRPKQASGEHEEHPVGAARAGGSPRRHRPGQAPQDRHRPPGIRACVICLLKCASVCSSVRELSSASPVASASKSTARVRTRNAISCMRSQSLVPVLLSGAVGACSWSTCACASAVHQLPPLRASTTPPSMHVA